MTSLEITSTDRLSAAMAEAGRLREQRQESRKIWEKHLPTFARDALVIRPKEGAPHKLALNGVQEELDALLDNQLAETGRVRAIIVKARQLGISTYVGGRFYHRTRYRPGRRALIMTHRDDATRNLMGMVKRFHSNDPEPPAATFNSKEELVLENDSGFMIGTAGNVDTGAGRSFTYQLAHLSELAMWKNASEHMTSVLDAVPDAEGSEIIIESTARGVGGPFHTMAMAARIADLAREQGDYGDTPYQLIFLPWFKHEEYETEPPEGWTPSEAVEELLVQYKLSMPKLYWAENKNKERAQIDGDSLDELCWRFRQEYPSNVDEAFRASRRGGYIPASVVAVARLRENPHQSDMPLIFGCDFATGGGGVGADRLMARQLEGRADEGGSEDGDSNVFIARRGRVLGKELYDRFIDHDSTAVANRLAAAIDKHRPARVFMDRGGGGAGVYDLLSHRGYARILELVDFGSAAKATDRRKYRNKRAEMYGEFRDWLQDGDIPDDELLEAEITAPWVKRDDETGLLLAPKREIRQKLKMSPDGADAAVLTFAAPVRPVATEITVGAGIYR